MRVVPWAENDTGADIDLDAPDLPARGPTTNRRLEVSGTQVCASTLASVSAAVVASFFGVTGTVMGTALASIVATVGGAFYSAGLRRTHQQIRQTQVTRLTDLLSGGTSGATATAADPDATMATDADADEATQPLEADGEPDRTRPGGRDPDLATAATRALKDDEGPTQPQPGWREWLGERRWGVAAGVAVVFVASLGLITLVETIGQRPLSSIAGDDRAQGTSISRLVGSDDGSENDDGNGSTTTSSTTTPETSEEDGGTGSTGGEEPGASSSGGSSGDSTTTTTSSSSPSTSRPTSTTAATTTSPTTSASSEAEPSEAAPSG